MKVLLLLAGRSRRFWPLSEKSLFPLCGKPLIGHQIERLRAAGCGDITLVGGSHNLPAVSALFPDLPTVQQEDLDLGMQGALLSALPSVGNEPVLIVSSNDIVESYAFEDLKAAAAERKVGGALLAQRVQRYFPGGYLKVIDGAIASIVEKPGEGNEPSDLVNIVAHIHNDPQALLGLLKTVRSDRDDGYEQAIAQLFPQQVYRAVPYHGSWQAVKYPWHLLHLLPLLLKDATASIHPAATVHPTAVIEGQVVIEEGARVLPHATVVGPSFIGRGTTIGNNALVRGSSVGRHCVVGYNTEVKSCVLADHVWTHSSYLGDSVVGENVSFGAGCVTGNLRLDEGEIASQWENEPLPSGLTKFGTIIGADCRIGIQVSTNPGVKIGPGTFIAGGTCVSQDIPDRSFVNTKDGKLMIRPNESAAPEPAAREKYRKGI